MQNRQTRRSARPSAIETPYPVRPAATAKSESYIYRMDEDYTINRFGASIARPISRLQTPCRRIFCRNFARLLRLRESVAPLEVLDARSGAPRLLAYQRRFAYRPQLTGGRHVQHYFRKNRRCMFCGDCCTTAWRTTFTRVR